MLSDFRTIAPKQIIDNPFSLIDDDWMLITSGNMESFNTMTASWAGFGILWHKPVVFCFVRPQRYTYQFMEKNELFSFCFLPNQFRDILNFCGTHSGRNVDKIKETGLLPMESSHKTIIFDQSRLILECRKIYYNDLDPMNFLNNKIHREYPKNDYHRMYVGEVINCLEKINK